MQYVTLKPREIIEYYGDSTCGDNIKRLMLSWDKPVDYSILFNSELLFSEIQKSFRWFDEYDKANCVYSFWTSTPLLLYLFSRYNVPIRYFRTNADKTDSDRIVQEINLYSRTDSEIEQEDKLIELCGWNPYEYWLAKSYWSKALYGLIISRIVLPDMYVDALEFVEQYYKSMTTVPQKNAINNIVEAKRLFINLKHQLVWMRDLSIRIADCDRIYCRHLLTEIGTMLTDAIYQNQFLERHFNIGIIEPAINCEPEYQKLSDMLQEFLQLRERLRKAMQASTVKEYESFDVFQFDNNGNPSAAEGSDAAQLLSLYERCSQMFH